MIAVLLTFERGKPVQVVTQIPKLEVGVRYVLLPDACSPNVDSTFSVRGILEHQGVVLDQTVLIPSC